MLYTYIPYEQILDSSRREEELSFKAVYRGEEVLLLKNSNGDYTISRLISTNPASYLKNEFAPGTTADRRNIKL